MEDLLRDKYIQEELRQKQVLPEDMSEDEAVALGILPEEDKDLEHNAAVANHDDPLAMPPADESNQEVNDDFTVSSSSNRSFLASLLGKKDGKTE